MLPQAAAALWVPLPFANQTVSGCVTESIILMGAAEFASLELHLPVPPSAGVEIDCPILATAMWEEL